VIPLSTAVDSAVIWRGSDGSGSLSAWTDGMG
jgi:hypothetical protein